MVRHFVSVCIFCFICATQSPCASHADVTHDGIQYHDNRKPYKDPSDLALPPNEYLPEIRDELNRNGLNVHVKSNRFIRDASDGDEEDEILRRLFYLFGDGKRMSMDGFKRLMNRLDDYVKPDTSLKDDNNNTKNNSKCFDRESLYNTIPTSQQIDDKLFKQVCPSIVYSLASDHRCTETAAIEQTDEEKLSGSRVYEWICSLAAITIISLCGVLGLAVIPMMQKKFYQPLLQFLVALAVGTLAGDALLHLLPHAMTPHVHGGEDEHHMHEMHETNMWKGFVAMLGLIFFFLMERIIMLAAKWRKKQQLKDKLPSRLKVIKPELTTQQLTNATEKQCKHKYSSFPYCYDEIKMEMMPPNNHFPSDVEMWETNRSPAEMINNAEVPIFALPHMNNPKVEANQNMTECPNDNENINCSEINKMLNTEINKIITNDAKDDTDSIEYTVILTEHENRHHGHSHTHGHVHSAPKTMTSVAWMVIMGDGLHNFTDGMAIGAAFASGIAGGFSTAVAVFCHELPHELGDFAMLLKAGMSMKQALFYNLLSSLLCLLGNIVGMWLGNAEDASSWIFALAAGMFLYIALVDMIPELSSGHEAEGTLLQCILHLGGLLSGFGIMTVIALFEHDLKSIFKE